LDESLGDWSIGVLNKGNKGLLGDVLTVKLTNVNWGLGLLLGPLWGLVLNGVISIIIREALIDDLGKSLTSIEGLGWWWGMGGLWVSLDHDGHGDVVVIGHILGLLSLSVKDRVEGVVTNNLSEGLEGNGLDGVKAEKGVNGEVNGLDLINWDVNEGSSAGESVGVNLGEVGSGWGSWDLGDEFWALGEDVLLVMVVMVALVLEHVLDFQIGHVLDISTSKGLLDSGGDGGDFGINLSGRGTVVSEGEDQGSGSEVLDNRSISFHTGIFLNILKKLNYFFTIIDLFMRLIIRKSKHFQYS